MRQNKKGAALVQVLLVTVVLAGMAAMLLRVSLSRTTTARRLNRAVSYQLLINACQAEVNMLWSVKRPESFARDLSTCHMYPNSRVYTCQPLTQDGVTYQVTATFTGTAPVNGQCALKYEVTTN